MSSTKGKSAGKGAGKGSKAAPADAAFVRQPPAVSIVRLADTFNPLQATLTGIPGLPSVSTMTVSSQFLILGTHPGIIVGRPMTQDLLRGFANPPGGGGATSGGLAAPLDIAAHRGRITCLHVHTTSSTATSASAPAAKAEWLLSGSEDGSLKLWELPSGTWRMGYAPVVGASRDASSPSPSSEANAAAGGSLVDVASSVESLTVDPSGGGGPEAAVVIAGLGNGTVTWWQMLTGVALGSLKAHHGPISSILVPCVPQADHPVALPTGGGPLVLTASGDGVSKLVSLKSRTLHTVMMAGGGVGGAGDGAPLLLCMTYDHPVAWIGRSDGRIVAFNVVTAAQQGAFQPSEAAVNSLVLDHVAGDVLLAATDGGVIYLLSRKLWQVRYVFNPSLWSRGVPSVANGAAPPHPLCLTHLCPWGGEAPAPTAEGVTPSNPSAAAKAMGLVFAATLEGAVQIWDVAATMQQIASVDEYTRQQLIAARQSSAAAAGASPKKGGGGKKGKK